MAHCKDEENFQRILECPICLERVKEPRCLPCLHSFCEECIGQHMDEKQDNGSFPCPMCNLKFQVPTYGVTGFRRNLHLIQISELFPEASEVKCDVCKFQDANNQATSMCIQCRDHLCQRCAAGHCLSKLTHNHKVVSLEEIKNGQHFEEIRRFQKVHCPIHPEKVMEVYCENCVKPLCLLCAMFEHDNHKKGGIEDAARKADVVLRGLLDPWKMASEHSLILSAERKNVLDKFGEDEERLTGEIQQLYQSFKDEIIEEIDMKMHESIEKLKIEIASARKQAEVAYNEAEISRESITSTLKYCQEILDSAQDAEKLQQFQDIKTHLESLDLRNLETEVITPVFKVQSGAFVIPDLKVTSVTEHDKERVKSSVSERTRLPDFIERASLSRCFTVGLPIKSFSYYFGLAVRGDWLITTGYDSHKVKVFDRSSGSLLLTVDKGQHKLQSPRGVTCSNNGEIFVTYGNIKGVVRYNSKGQVVKVTRNLFSGVGGITCHQDQLIVSDPNGGRMLMTDFDCNIRKFITKVPLGLSTFKPWYVCVDSKGHLVVSDNGQGRVHVINPQQPAIIKTFTDQLGSDLRGVCVDLWGHIIVADYSNDQVVLLSDQSEQTRVLITSDQVSGPVDLAVTGLGEVAVLERGTGNVKVFKYANV